MPIGEGNATPLQYSCLENPMDGGAWKAAVHGVAKSRTQLSNFTFHFHALEKEIAIHSSVLSWRITGTAEPGGLLSKGSHRVGHDKRLSSSSSSTCLWGLPCGSEVKKLPTMQEPWARSLGQEDTLVEEMASHSNILAWRIP